MKYQSTVFRQLLEFVPRDSFQRIVRQYEGDKRVRTFRCWDQFMALVYAQIRSLDSLRAIKTGLEAQSRHWYHLDIQSISKSTFADANNKRPSEIYQTLFDYLLQKCQQFSRKHFEFNNPIRSIDATVIDLCYSLFPWAKYRTTKGAIKLHVELEHNGYLPEMVVITEGNIHESQVFKGIEFKPDSIYTFDRGYHDFKVYNKIHKSGAKFVARAKKDMNYAVLAEQSSIHENVISDEEIQVPWLHRTQASKRPKYPDILRLVTYEDPETGKVYRFITNIEDMKAETIALIYKQRWQIELFFKWIKQNLKIKSFIGTSKNAVMTQIWIAMIVYLLIWYFKHQTKYDGSLLTLIRILNELLFSRVYLLDILGMTNSHPPNHFDSSQLKLFLLKS